MNTHRTSQSDDGPAQIYERAAEQALWPAYADFADLTAIESIPLEQRGLPESTYALLERAATRWPDKIATRSLPDASRWQHPADRTFAQLAADVRRTANAFGSLGVTRTDAVALVSPNCDEMLISLLAAEAAGVAVPINPSLDAAHAEHLLRLSRARILVVAGPELDRSAWERGRTLATAVRADAVIVLRPTGAAGPPPPLEPLDGTQVSYLAQIAAAYDATRLLATPPRAGDLASYFHTGGTTGAPKLAAHTHANEVTDAWMLAANQELDGESVLFGALPLFHVNALVVTVLAPLFRGQSVVWAGPLGYRDPALYAEFWKLVEHYQIATLSAVPTVYSVLAHMPVDADISSLRFAAVGASPLPRSVRDAFETATSVPLCEGYGLTEATCASARSFPRTPRHHAVGQRLPYQRLKAVTVDDDGTWIDTPPGTVGNIVVAGPTVFPGYLVRSSPDGPVLDGHGKLRNGWLDTGDLGSVDADGFVTLTGRSKDLIIRGGHNLDPATIEDALLTHPQVTGASAIGRPDPHAGEVPVVYVTVAAPVSRDDLLAHAAAHVSEPAAAPKDVLVVDALPVTDLGKPYKPELRRDATHRVVLTALAGIDASATTVLDSGTPLVLIRTTDPQSVTRALGSYAIRWQHQ
jgi:fatty-acyl-CoA synthase